MFAALAVALVVTYRSSGVLNFATGAQALYAAYTYSLLRNGQLLQPIPGISPTISVGSDLGFWPAVLITLAISAVMRRLGLPADLPPAAQPPTRGQGRRLHRADGPPDRHRELSGRHGGHRGQPDLPPEPRQVSRRRHLRRPVAPGGHHHRHRDRADGRLSVHPIFGLATRASARDRRGGAPS